MTGSDEGLHMCNPQCYSHTIIVLTVNYTVGVHMSANATLRNNKTVLPSAISLNEN